MRFYFIPNRRFWQLALIVLALLFVFAVPVMAQDGSTPSDPLAAQFGIFFAAAAAVNRLVEFVKPRINATSLSEDGKKAALTFVAVAAGIAAAIAGQLNLAVSASNVPPAAGIMFTGALLGLGADTLHIILDLVYGWRDMITSPPSSLPPGAG
jgi:hypothetical protein